MRLSQQSWPAERWRRLTRAAHPADTTPTTPPSRTRWNS